MRLIVFVFLGGRLVMVVRGAQSLAVRCLQKGGLKYDLEGKYVSGRNMDAVRGTHGWNLPGWVLQEFSGEDHQAIEKQTK